MRIDDLECICGARLEPLAVDGGVVLACAADCGAVAAEPAPNLDGAIDNWNAALPPPPIDGALHAYAQECAVALTYIQSTAELVHLAPVATFLVEYLRLLSPHRPAGDRPLDPPP